MRTSLSLLNCTLLGLAHAALADGEFGVIQRGPHQRTWQRAVQMPGPGGRTITQYRTYIELATGLHYWKDGTWLESKEEIELFQDGAMARQGQHQVLFAPNLNTVGAIDLLTPDGQRLASRVVGLAYFDAASGQSVLIAETKDALGQLVAPNGLLYADAFTDVRADYRCAYTVWGFEAEVILRQQPPSPAAWKFNPETTRLQVWTEFFDPPAPEKRVSFISRETDPAVRQGMAEPDFLDEQLDFGAMFMGRGKAFALGDEPLDEHAVPVGKTWGGTPDGRRFLVESVSYAALQPLLQGLPLAAAGKPAEQDAPPMLARKPAPVPAAQFAARLPKAPAVKRSAWEKIQMARVTPSLQPSTFHAPPARGVILDYTLVNADKSNLVFQADTTYYVSGPVNLRGSNTVFEGGAVIKYAPTNTAKLVLKSNLTWQASAYRPVVMTARDDHSVGEAIGSASLSGYYASYALYVDSYAAGTNFNLHHLRISHAHTAVCFFGGSDHTLAHAQIVNCGTAIMNYYASFSLRNGLACQLATGFSGSGMNNTTGRLEHVTWHTVTTLHNGNTTLFLTNCLLAGVTNLGAFTGESNGTNNPGESVFQTVGGGAHYLATDSPYRDTGTTNINPTLLTELKARTTYPPLVLSNATLSVPTTFSPRAPRDTDLPDLGYHYDPLDYAFGGVDGNTDLTFAAGTAVGWFRTSSGWYHAGHGLHLADQQTATFDGRADAPAYWVRCSVVQEGNTGLWEGGYGAGGITGWADQELEDVSLSPEVRARFTRFSVLAGEGGCHFRDDCLL
jgi:hypothetical protein